MGLRQQKTGTMDPDLEHSWDLTPQEAINLQSRLRSRVIQFDDFGKIEVIAGTDVSYAAPSKEARAVVVLLSYPDLEIITYAIHTQISDFPYIPGLLSFREAPPLLECFRKMKTKPDMLLCDGHGLAHPRRFGLACHLGLLLNIPTIGVAKSRLVGEHQEIPKKRGAWQSLTHNGERIGAVLRSREKVKPIYVSIGHRVCLETAVELVIDCVTRYRLPETTRWAHRLSKENTLE
jgi:deoxyribonuclease V